MYDTDFREHLRQRGWNPCLHTYVDYDKQIVTFPIFTYGGKYIGYQRYDWRAPKKRDNGPKGRYFTWVGEAHKRCYAYGTENLFNCGPLFVVEGVWDAIRVTMNWYDCLALLTATPTKETIQWLRMISWGRPIVAIADEDGKLGRGWADTQVIPPAHDMSDMTHEDAGRWLEGIATPLNFG